MSAAALPADLLALPRVDDRRDHARPLGELHQLRAPLPTGRRIPLLPLDPVRLERISRCLAVRTRRLDVHDAHPPRLPTKHSALSTERYSSPSARPAS